MTDLIPWSEWRPDVSSYKGQHTQYLKNVVPRADGYGPFPNYAALTDTLPDDCRGYFVAYDDDGSVKLFAGTVDNLYLLDNTDFTWDEVSKTSDVYSVPATDQWQFAQFGLHVIAVNAGSTPQIYTMGTSSAFADLTGSPPQARYVSVVNEFLVLSGLVGNPFRVQWSARSDVTGWTAGTDESDFQDFTDGGIVRTVAGGEYGFIFQDRAIRKMTYAPGSPIIFSITRPLLDKGIEAPLSIVTAGNNVFFLGNDGFYQIDPLGAIIPIGKEKFDRWFFTDWNDSEKQLMIGANDPQGTRVFWAYQSQNGTANLFDKILCYDYILKKATTIEMMGQYITSFARPGVTLEGLEDIGFANIDTMPGSFDDFPAAFAAEISMAGPADTIGFFSGDALEATFETAEAAIGDRKMFSTGMRPVTDATSVYGSVKHREALNATEIETDETAIETNGFIPHLIEARLFKFKNRIPAGTPWTFSTGVEPVADVAGEE